MSSRDMRSAGPDKPSMARTGGPQGFSSPSSHREKTRVAPTWLVPFSFLLHYSRCRDVRMVIAWAKSSPAVKKLRRIVGLFASVRSGTQPRSLFAVVVALAASSYLAAQVSINNDVHVLPYAMRSSPGHTKPVIRA